MGAPNVVIVLVDDLGFGTSSAFGGPCEMPAVERLADGGLRYTRFSCRRGWQEKYRGRFGHGWDHEREVTLRRQRELGVVPEDAELAPWAEGVPTG
ncbi:sulfatase-like hydrolase/transferase [Streptomyces sp. NPDC002092]